MQLSIGTLNILHPEFAVKHQEQAGLLPGTQLSNWEKRRINIVNEIGKANLDILGLQEISYESLADLKPSLELQGYAARHVPNPRGDGLAIIYKTNRFTELLFKPLRVHSDGVACFIDLLDKDSGKIARVANCHLLGGPSGPINGKIQLSEVSIALDLSSQYEIDLKAILGDFNEDHLHDDKKQILVKNNYVSDGVFVITEPSKNRQIDWIFIRQCSEKTVLNLTNVPVPSFTLPTSDHHLKVTYVKLANTKLAIT